MDYNKLYGGNSELDILIRQKTAEGWKMFAHEHPEENTTIDVILTDGEVIENVTFLQKQLYKDDRNLGTCAIARFWMPKNVKSNDIYTIWDRATDTVEEISEQEATDICIHAPYHTGPYGYMGCRIDKVLYRESEEEGKLLAVRHNNKWLVIPDNQVPFMEAELSFNAYELTPVPEGTIIFDNGGGVTVQLPGFAHYYSGHEGAIKQAAEDVAEYIQSGTTEGWEGHEEAEAELVPNDEDIRNGSYRIYSLAEIIQESKVEDSAGWANIDEFCVWIAKFIR